jgi:hypothetical protein
VLKENKYRDKKGRFIKGFTNSRTGKTGFVGYWEGKKRPPLSDEWKEKISIANKGRKLLEETKLKISNSHKGTQKPWAKPPHRKGAENNLWKGGNSKNYKTGYYSKKYKDWRISVFKRDNYTCQECTKKGVYLTAHHIKSFALYPELRFELNNGLTLCEDCHKKTDNYKGRCLMRKQLILEGSN